MRGHDKEKRDLEKYAIEWFLPQYNNIKGENFSVLSRGESPDVILGSTNGYKIGLEITHLFYDNEEAKTLLGRTNKKMKSQRFDNLINKLNMRIKDKSAKSFSYKCDFPILLLIRSASPIFTVSDFKKAKNEIIIPNNAFSEIWLLAEADKSPTRSWELIHLYTSK